jgi:hypothetical protein
MVTVPVRDEPPFGAMFNARFPFPVPLAAFVMVSQDRSLETALHPHVDFEELMATFALPPEAGEERLRGVIESVQTLGANCEMLIDACATLSAVVTRIVALRGPLLPGLLATL